MDREGERVLGAVVLFRDLILCRDAGTTFLVPIFALKDDSKADAPGIICDCREGGVNTVHTRVAGLVDNRSR